MPQLKIGIIGTGKLATGLADYIKNDTQHTIARIYSKRNIEGITNVETTNCIKTLQTNCDILIDCTTDGFDERADKITLPLIIATTQERNIVPKCPILELPLSNFSWNLISNLLIKLAKSGKYSFNICDIHHKHKKDAPSGAARALIEALQNLNAKVECTYERVGEIIGIHSITAISEYDMIKIEHQSFSRKSFSHSLVNAAEWLITKIEKGPKVYTALDWVQDSYSA